MGMRTVAKSTKAELPTSSTIQLFSVRVNLSSAIGHPFDFTRNRLCPTNKTYMM